MAAASLLPTTPRSEMQPILPTPPRSTMLPLLLPTPSGVTLLLAVSTMPGRADFVQRWDSIKKYKMACSPASSSSSSSDTGGSSCRADVVGRWDVHKKYKAPGSVTSSSSSSDSGRAESVERWDTKKLFSTTCGTSTQTDRGRQDGNNKRPPSRASSAERWDLYKKPRPEETERLLQTDGTTTTAKVATMTAMHNVMTRTPQATFAGPNFYASPEPTMLPMPSFFLRAH